MTPPLLEDCMAAIIDYRGKTPRKTTTGIPLITAKIVKHGRIEPADEFIDPSEYDDWMRRGLPQVGDVVITTEAPLGEVAQLTTERVALAQRLILLRGKERVLDNTYLKYLLMSSPFQASLRSRASGTTVYGIKQSELRKIPLELPSFDCQVAIASVLQSLDDKIEQNRRTSQALQRLARATFKAWFVDFEPVKAKAAGATSFPGMPAEAFESLPMRLVDSELGPVPEGWDAGKLGDVIDIHDSRRIPLSKKQREERPGPYRYYGAAGVVDYIDEFLFEGIYVLTGEDGTVTNADGNPVTQYVWGQFWVNNHAHVLTAKPLLSNEHLLLLLQSLIVKPYVTGAVQPKLSQGNLKSIPVVLPPSELAKVFGRILDPLFSVVRSAADESARLAGLRDYLLPRLLSGRVRVSTDTKLN